MILRLFSNLSNSTILWPQGQGEGFSFCPEQRQGSSLPHPARLPSVQWEACLSSSPGWASRQGCLSTYATMIPGINLPLRLLNPSQPREFFSGHITKKLIKLGTPEPLTPLTYLSSLGDLQIPELPAAEGLSSSLAPWDVWLSAHDSPERPWAFCLHFCLSLSATLVGTMLVLI